MLPRKVEKTIKEWIGNGKTALLVEGARQVGKTYIICENNKEYDIKEAFIFANCNIKQAGKETYLPVYMCTFINNNAELPLLTLL